MEGDPPPEPTQLTLKVAQLWRFVENGFGSMDFNGLETGLELYGLNDEDLDLVLLLLTTIKFFKG